MNEGIVRRLAAALDAVCDDDRDFRECAVRTGLAPLIARVTGDFRLEFPEAEIAFRRLRDRLSLECAESISDAMDDAGVAHLFFKGIALIEGPYKPGDRDLADIDLFVLGVDRDTAITALTGAGFVVLPDPEQSGPAPLRSTLALARQLPGDIDSLNVDLHWALDPLDRLLPRSGRDLPEHYWASALRAGGFPTPDPQHHLALLVHHLVRSDYLHLRGGLDIALLLVRMDPPAVAEVYDLCDELRCGRAARVLIPSLARAFDIQPHSSAVSVPRGSLAGMLNIDAWLDWWHRLPDSESAAITPGRIATRSRSLGLVASVGLLRDVILPPRAFLRWRWSGDSLPRSLFRHWRQLSLKALRGRRLRR